MTRDAHPPTRPADASDVPAAAAHPSGAVGHHRPRGRLPHSGLLIVAGQLLLLLAVPALDDGAKRVPPAVFAAAMAVSALTVWALGNRATSLALATVCGLGLLGMVFAHQPLSMGRLAGTLALIGAYAFAAVLCVRTAFSAGLSPTQRILCGAACYPMVGVVFAVIHTAIALFDDSAYAFPGAADAGRERRWIDAFWLSFSLLTTTGFAELAPAGRWGYTAAMLEAVCGVLFPATLIARIASLPAPDPGAGGQRAT